MRQPTDDSHIFKRHMRTAVIHRRDAGIGRNHFHIRLLIIHRHKQLIQATTTSKRSEGMKERDMSGNGKSGSHAYHIGLHNAAVNHLIRQFFLHGIHSHAAH